MCVRACVCSGERPSFVKALGPQLTLLPTRPTLTLVLIFTRTFTLTPIPHLYSLPCGVSGDNAVKVYLCQVRLEPLQSETLHNLGGGGGGVKPGG